MHVKRSWRSRPSALAPSSFYNARSRLKRIPGCATFLLLGSEHFFSACGCGAGVASPADRPFICRRKLVTVLSTVVRSQLAEHPGRQSDKNTLGIRMSSEAFARFVFLPGALRTPGGISVTSGLPTPSTQSQLLDLLPEDSLLWEPLGGVSSRPLPFGVDRGAPVSRPKSEGRGRSEFLNWHGCQR